MYYTGDGVTQDYQEAKKWYHMYLLSSQYPLEQGDSTVQFNLASIYVKEEDYQEAAKWYRLAAELGNYEAQFLLGRIYEVGEGVPQDYQEAVKWYRLAAAPGYADAQYNLGMMYLNGEGVAKDYVHAHMWFNIAARTGNKDAIKYREIVAKIMTPSQIAGAQKMVRDCVKKNSTHFITYKDC